MANSSKPVKWTVGLITCPRPNGHYLEQTLISFSKTGFEQPWIFAEPNSLLPSNCFKQLTVRSKRFGTWTNWATGLYQLLLTEPETDYFLMIEDDVAFCQDIKPFLEENLSRLEPFAAISLFTPGNLHKTNTTGFHNLSLGMRTCSSAAIVMSKFQVISFFTDSDVQNHRFIDIFSKDEAFWQKRVDPRNSLKDAVIGLWAEKKSLPIFYHSPSLTEHIGESSILTDSPLTVENGRKSKDFVGQNKSAMEFLPTTISRNKEIPLF